jgi:hypothetical protein
MEIFVEQLPAQWASALVNNDWSGIEHYAPEDADQAKEWLANSGLSVLSCGEVPFFERYQGLLTECLDYYCVKK